MDQLTNNNYPYRSSDQPAYGNNFPINTTYPPIQQQQYPQYPPNYPPQYSYQQQPYPGGNSTQPGYIPPNQYNLPLNQQSHSGSSETEIRKEIKELERTLDQGWYKAYLIWLYFMIFMGVLDIMQNFVAVFTIGEAGWYISSFICGFWLVSQSVIGVAAIQNKNVRKAQRALTLMLIFIILNLGVIITFAIWYGNIHTRYYHYYWDFGYERLEQAYVLTILVLYNCCFVFHIGVTILGAVKTRKLLERRMTLHNSIIPL